MAITKADFDTLLSLMAKAEDMARTLALTIPDKTLAHEIADGARSMRHQIEMTERITIPSCASKGWITSDKPKVTRKAKAPKAEAKAEPTASTAETI